MMLMRQFMNCLYGAEIKRGEHKVRPYVITLLHSYIYLFTIFATVPSAFTV